MHFSTTKQVYSHKKIAVIIAAVLSLTACDSIPFFDKTPDYKSAGRSRPLEVPPDLTSASRSDTFSVPGGSTSYSTYNQGGPAELEQERILPNPENVKIERAGSQRWLVVQADPEKIWPIIREFWTELGFAVRVENAETGVMETEWVDSSNITKDDKGGYLDKFQGWLDKLNTLQSRQKFRTRIDRGETGTTEIFLSHRSVADSVKDDGIERVRTSAGTYDLGYKLKTKQTTLEQDRANEEDIDAELMRRLMVRLGVDANKSREIIAKTEVKARAKILSESDGTSKLVVFDAFDRAWRRVGLSLDRVGFVVEDRDRSKGVFFVRYTDVAIDDAPVKKEKGLIESLQFWKNDSNSENNAEVVGKDAKKIENDESITEKLKFWEVKEKEKNNLERLYLVKVDDKEDGSALVTVTNRDGAINKSNTARRMINLLFDQLK